MLVLALISVALNVAILVLIVRLSRARRSDTTPQTAAVVNAAPRVIHMTDAREAELSAKISGRGE
jgi:hypothetical protein